MTGMDMEAWAALLFALSCNLDTVALALSYAARGIALPRGGGGVIAGATTAVTCISLLLGRIGGGLLSAFPGLADALGALVLVGIGAWFLLDALRQGSGGEKEEGRPAGLGSCAVLAGTLAVNNAGAGAAAGVSGVSPLWAGIWNFLVTLLALGLGSALGRRLPGKRLGRLALPLSGILLMLLGILELVL